MEAEQQKAIIAHGEKLKQFFNLDPSVDPMKLCKALRRLEVRCHRITTDACNGVIEPYDAEQEESVILDKVDKLVNFRAKNIKVFVNGDPRGYALKIGLEHEEQIRKVNLSRDWGGYGLIAPEL